MCRLLSRVFLGAFLSAAVWPVLASAQQHQASGGDKSSDFVRLYDRAKQTQDPEEAISLGTAALAIEADLPRWPLEQPREYVRGELFFRTGSAYQARRQGERADNLEKAIEFLEAARALASQESYPKEWAAVHDALGNAYRYRLRGEHGDNLEKALTHFEAALTVRTREAFPRDWAATQNSLAIVYSGRIRGERADNVEAAIAHFEAALTVITREQNDWAWALLQDNLGAIYRSRLRGDRADNIEKSIRYHDAALSVRTREAFPRDWAGTQRNLAMAHLDRVRGERADNQEKAINHFEAALSVTTREAFPLQWAQIHNSLSGLYEGRVRGERADNLEKAIAHSGAALTAVTRGAFPLEWAAAQSRLGQVYVTRIRGQRADNIEKAIGYLNAALEVATRPTSPQGWATLQRQLGSAYIGRVLGNRADNVEKAISHFDAALSVISRDAFPLGWSHIQNSLGAAYRSRIHGERADNLEKAIAHFEAALTVATREASPQGWAESRTHLAQAMLDRILGNRTENVKAAVAHFESALTVRTLEARPRLHLQTARGLGRALIAAQEWNKASAIYASARAAFLLLFGEGLGEIEALDLIVVAGPLFAEAALVAAQSGENEKAFVLAAEGRARLMSVALKLQGLELSAEQRTRLDELRRKVRAEQDSVESSEGLERAAAIEQLANLRVELLGLVKSADLARGTTDSALAKARTIIPAGGAMVVPVLTSVGAKILIATANKDGVEVTALDLPQLSTDRINVLIRGEGKDGTTGGWIDAYRINYLQGAAFERRWPEWLDAIDKLGPDLWQLFGARLDAALKERGVKSGTPLIWLPSGALGILPLGVAQDPATKRRLADDYEIVYAPSLEALTAAKNQIAKAPSATLSAIINPTGDLPGTEKEGAIVASHFSGAARTVLERTAATPDAVLASLKGKTHWHFASHGTFSWDDARQSALLMHGHTRLNVGRLLETDGLGRPRLVVLSACETGLYDINRNPDEFIGLPGTFTALGAAGVVGTLWPVSDTATALLIAKFYELHMGAGIPPPTALRSAQAWLREATTDDLNAYARTATAQGRFEIRHLAEIEQALSPKGLARSRNRGTVEWVARDHNSTAGKSLFRPAKKLARPYAHPYFWAGFIHTGL